jgi:alkylation response protein AidB-like acyl-CoA dehydrogenase
VDFELSHARQEIKDRAAGFATGRLLFTLANGTGRRGCGGTLAVRTSAGTLPILVYGNEEQKARFVSDLARGRRSGASS